MKGTLFNMQLHSRWDLYACGIGMGPGVELVYGM